MDNLISHTSWMRDTSDHTRVTALSVPGTHDTCSVDGLFGLGKTQNLDLTDQLNAGTRFIDIRLAHYRDNVYVHHDIVHMGECYADVLNVCSDSSGNTPPKPSSSQSKTKIVSTAPSAVLPPSAVLKNLEETEPTGWSD
jgi:hypothetical protein